MNSYWLLTALLLVFASSGCLRLRKLRDDPKLEFLKSEFWSKYPMFWAAFDAIFTANKTSLYFECLYCCRSSNELDYWHQKSIQRITHRLQDATQVTKASQTHPLSRPKTFQWPAKDVPKTSGEPLGSSLGGSWEVFGRLDFWRLFRFGVIFLSKNE